MGGIEYYFGGGIQRGRPGQTHFGRPMEVIDIGYVEGEEVIVVEMVRNEGQFVREVGWAC